MLDKILRLGKDTAIYGLSSIVGRFLNFLLVPFYTNYLLPSEYGVVANVYAYIAFAFVLFGYGMENAYMRYVASLELGDRRENFSTPFFSLVLTSLLCSGALHLFASPVAGIIGLSEAQSLLVVYAAWILCFDTLMIVPYASLRMEEQAKVFAGVRVFHIVLNVLLNIVFIIAVGMKAEGVLLANLIASVVTMALLAWLTRRNVVLRFSVPLYKELLRFGLPYIPAGLAGIAIQVIDRPILKALTDDATVGIYQANYRLGIIMMLCVGMFDYAWRPFFLTQANSEGARELFARIFTYFIGVLLFVFIAVSLLIDDLVRVELFGGYFFSPAYWEGVVIVPWILLAYIFTGAYVNFVVGVNIEKKTHYLPYVTGLGALVNIGANVLLIPLYGMMGAAYATLLSYVVMAVGMYFASQQFYRVEYEWKKVVRMATITVLVIGVGGWFGLEPLTVSGILVKLALIASFAVLSLFTGVIEKKEIDEVRSILVERYKTRTAAPMVNDIPGQP